MPNWECAYGSSSSSGSRTLHMYRLRLYSLHIRGRCTNGQAESTPGPEDQYLNAAKRQASFLASCTPATVVTQILTTRPATVRLSNDGDSFSVDTGEIASIGTEACGQKQIFHVSCGLNQRYSPSDWSGSGLCDVLPASEAVRAAQRNQRLQQEMDAAVGSTTQNME